MPEVVDLSHSPSHFSAPASPSPSSSSPTRVSSSSSSSLCPCVSFSFQYDVIIHSGDEDGDSVRTDCEEEETRTPSYTGDEDSDSVRTDCEEEEMRTPSYTGDEDGDSVRTICEEEEEESDRQRRDRLPVLALLLEIFRKSLMAFKSTDRRELCPMEIGCPTDVHHVAHVTFDSFHGFLGLPGEFEPEMPTRPPNASTTVFGVSTESMQLSFDSRGNSVPTILLLMQEKLYALGGLQAEGIFRVAAENSQEEYVRDQLNLGVLPDSIDVHCLAGLIKAWFRELPTGVLDSLSPEQVMQCQTEEDFDEIVRLLPPTEAALLDWTINLMADVVQEERMNKMDARNIALVFAPNMTQMADPLTALRYAVQVMNFIKTLILKTLGERKVSVVEPPSASRLETSHENAHQSPSQNCQDNIAQEKEKQVQAFIAEEPISDISPNSSQNNLIDGEAGSSLTSSEKLNPDGEWFLWD